jgi:hypothetical protein
MSFRTLIAVGAVVATVPFTVAQAQVVAPAAPATPAAPKPVLSPRDTTRATVGSAKVVVDYSRPSKRGRVVFDSLVPYGKVWRTGANMATTLVTDKALVIGGKDVPAGTYTLFSVPGKTEWTLIINKQTGQRGTEYTEGQDFARVPMTVGVLSSPVEKFQILVENGKLHLRWDTTDAFVSIAEKK